MTVIELQRIHRDFQVGDQVVHALDDVNLQVEAGDYLSIMGPSGSGKSTLLNLIGLLDRATRGHYILNGQDVTALSDTEQAITRATVMEPAVLLADEPTGNLDHQSGLDVVGMLEALNDRGITLVVVTHDAELGQRARRQLHMLDGRIQQALERNRDAG